MESDRTFCSLNKPFGQALRGCPTSRNCSACIATTGNPTRRAATKWRSSTLTGNTTDRIMCQHTNISAAASASLAARTAFTGNSLTVGPAWPSQTALLIGCSTRRAVNTSSMAAQSRSCLNLRRPGPPTRVLSNGIPDAPSRALNRQTL